MPPYNKERKISGRFCKDCEEWFQPISQYNFFCEKCIKKRIKIRAENSKKLPIQPSKELENFYENYGIK